jgi:hypothetical protein
MDRMGATASKLAMMNPHEMIRVLKLARNFIEYARYELEDGKATIGDQFPKKDDADGVLREIDSTLSSLK